MKKRLLSGLCLALCAACALSLFPFTGKAAAQSRDSWVLLRVRDLGGVVSGLDDAARSALKGKGAPLPSEMIEQQVGKLTFLDPKRSVTALVDVSQTKPTAFCLVPILQKNDAFRDKMQAVETKDAYIFTQPAGMAIPPEVAGRLAAASKDKMTDTVSVDLPLASLMASVKPQIDQGLEKLSDQAAGQQGFSPQDLKSALESVVGVLDQVKTMTVGLSWDKELYRARFTAKAVQGSELFRMLSAPAPKDLLLAGYTPSGIITMRTRPYDAKDMLKLLSGMYSALGMDISCFSELAGMMTGETAGGINFTKNRMVMEGMWVLDKEGRTAEDFTAQWLACSEKMMKAMQEKAGVQAAAPMPLPKKTKDSTVLGRQVKGIKVEAATGKGAAPGVSYELRMAEVGNIMVFGPDDKAVARLIPQAEKLKATPSDAPFMKMDMDLAALLKWAVSLEPGATPLKIKGPAKLSFIMDAGNGEATASYAMKAADGKKLVASLGSLIPKPAANAVNVDTGAAVDLSGEGPQAQGAPSIPADEATELTRKGNLAMIYGGPKEAIKLYRQALALNPESAVTHFNLAQAYCEQEKYLMALAEADLALELDPGNPEYLYGRARILLLSGDKAGAVVGFTEAAALGSSQAQAWLNRMSK
ncbi:MAG: tetratricopeptide repeat protein [Thermodesulfobacteriota bacterium]